MEGIFESNPPHCEQKKIMISSNNLEYEDTKSNWKNEVEDEGSQSNWEYREEDKDSKSNWEYE